MISRCGASRLGAALALGASIVWGAGSVSAEKSSRTRAIEFAAEEITLEVVDGTARIHAVYDFRNLAEREIVLPLVYPFHIDASCDYPFAVQAYVQAEGDSLPLPTIDDVDLGAARLRLDLPPKSVTRWTVDYAQRIRGSHATYILTTTAAWGKPLEEATYRFVVPASLREVRTWPGAEEVWADEETRILQTQRQDFLPEQNMEVHWRSEK